MAAEKQDLFRKIPGVDRLLLEPRLEEASSRYPRNLLLKAIHLVLDRLRKSIGEGKDIREEDLRDDRVADTATWSMTWSKENAGAGMSTWRSS